MSETWYEAWNGSVTAIEIESATEKMVTLRNGRRRKRDNWCPVFPTWQEAHQRLIDDSNTKIENYKLNLQREQSYLDRVKKLTPSDRAGK